MSKTNSIKLITPYKNYPPIISISLLNSSSHSWKKIPKTKRILQITTTQMSQKVNTQSKKVSPSNQPANHHLPTNPPTQHPTANSSPKPCHNRYFAVSPTSSWTCMLLTSTSTTTSCNSTPFASTNTLTNTSLQNKSHNSLLSSFSLTPS